MATWPRSCAINGKQLDAGPEKNSTIDAANSTLDLVLRKHCQVLSPEGANAPLSADFVSSMADKYVLTLTTGDVTDHFQSQSF